MAQQLINIGAAPNDGTGDPLRTGGQKANANFTELYGQFFESNYVVIKDLADLDNKVPAVANVRTFDASTLYVVAAPGFDDSANDWELQDGTTIDFQARTATTVNINMLRNQSGNYALRNGTLLMTAGFGLDGGSFDAENMIFGGSAGGDIENMTNVRFEDCVWALFPDDIVFSGSLGQAFFVNNYTLGGGLQPSMTGELFEFSATSGDRTVQIVTSTFSSDCDPAMTFFRDSTGAHIGSVIGCYAPSTNAAGFADSTTYTGTWALNWTFSACGFGVINTVPNGFLSTASNNLVTAGSATPVAINAPFTLAALSQRFTESSNGVLRYDDTTDRHFTLSASGNVRRATGAAALDVQFDLLVNGSSVQTAIITISGANFFNWSFTQAPVQLSATDTVEVRVSQPAGAVNVVIGNMGLIVS